MRIIKAGKLPPKEKKWSVSNADACSCTNEQTYIQTNGKVVGSYAQRVRST